MKNSSYKSDKIIVTFIIKSLVSTVASVAFYSYLLSLLSMKLSFPLSYAGVLSIFVCLFCALTISAVSVWGYKNNGALMGILCQLPLIFYSAINLIFNENSLLFFAIKMIIIIAVGALTGLLITAKNKRVRI